MRNYTVSRSAAQASLISIENMFSSINRGLPSLWCRQRWLHNSRGNVQHCWCHLSNGGKCSRHQMKAYNIKINMSGLCQFAELPFFTVLSLWPITISLSAVLVAFSLFTDSRHESVQITSRSHWAALGTTFSNSYRCLSLTHKEISSL